ncbi:serpin 85F isoform 1-T2 [Glossina fuscipes fuscipes]
MFILKRKNFCKSVVVLLMHSVFLNSYEAHIIQVDHDRFEHSSILKPYLPPLLLPHVTSVSHTEEIISGQSENELSPAELMVDLTNDLTYRIMYYHSILNRNNFAFSPTALMSILIALYEGSAGRSATELKTTLFLPSNRDIIRVGYRDIHRRLRTYFFDTDNPLKGLSLNKENVTISREYENILIFYGYDLGMDMISTMMPDITTTTSKSRPSKGTSIPETTEKQSPSIPTEATIKVSTTSPTITTTTPMTDILTTSETVTSGTTINDKENPSSETTTTFDSKESMQEVTTTAPIEGITEGEAVSNVEAAELVSSFIADDNSEPFARIQKVRVTRLPSAKLQAPLSSMKPKVNYLPAKRSNRKLIKRHKRHLFGYKDLNSNLFVTLFNSEHPTAHLPNIGEHHSVDIPNLNVISNHYGTELNPNFITSTNNGEIGNAIKQNYNTDVISHVFYLGNQQTIYTTFKVYNAVLYYKYFNNLGMSAIELELNTPEYNLLILLPDFHTDLVTAAASLRFAPKLRLLRKQLKPKWVQATIPDFQLNGVMFLTNDLQNMGIGDIFEPNRADFRPMTDEKSIYVRHIEQSINIHIHTHPINQLRRTNGAQTQPIQISVNHPFMFFIVDRDLDVAVMAGRILNPLNVRIQ